ncbi:LytS/YhcK type 5TM receptor domain-containing protein [Desulfocurvibacter africanus]|uniref:histidine kinase n=1 Tax=Desulfocurvibacter africanus subsp. africanus str. Walvis Bay TaxID=690850 RepID=F3YYR0_DESAF|nr:LytS/YhcK type 5TM receptor domain-containing protein [Desulfocurvibacter africanus]EGJ51886.1 signal transduction histidine kinase, LytS [Desulfocurvibacter africanus subsp. africanus str. Walvis Bay]
MSMDVLFLALLQRVGIIVASAFVLLLITPMHRLGFGFLSQPNRIVTTVLFGALGILGTYAADPVLDSYANLRAMSVITAGLFGGPIVGTGAAFIASTHRILIDVGGFSAIPCALATLMEGALAGWLSTRLTDRLSWREALLLALAGESVHMLLVLVMSKPFDKALALVELIALPMILINAIGAALFIKAISTAYEYGDRRDSFRAKELLDIANQTVSHLRSGLNRKSAEATARIILAHLPVAAVALTDASRVLAHVGVGSDHHETGKPLLTRATRTVVAKGKAMYVDTTQGIGCYLKGCPLSQAIIVPLEKGGKVVGSLKLYGDREHRLDRFHVALVRGLGRLFSTQVELEDIQINAQLLSQAEIRRLQAQINPHFLFNSLNTIASFTRSQPEKARELILDLASYMRKNLDNARSWVLLDDELAQVAAYLAIEEARFGERLRARVISDPAFGQWPVPPLTIQPLVENAVKHGLQPLEEGGEVIIKICRDGRELSVSISDSGVGMQPGRAEKMLVGNDGNGSEGIGLCNVHARLRTLFGPNYGLRIDSALGKGTTATFRIPPSWAG